MGLHNARKRGQKSEARKKNEKCSQFHHFAKSWCYGQNVDSGSKALKDHYILLFHKVRAFWVIKEVGREGMHRTGKGVFHQDKFNLFCWESGKKNNIGLMANNINNSSNYYTLVFMCQVRCQALCFLSPRKSVN